MVGLNGEARVAALYVRAGANVSVHARAYCEAMLMCKEERTPAWRRRRIGLFCLISVGYWST